MSTNGSQNPQQAWYLNEVPPLPSIPMSQFAMSPTNSPPPWRGGGPYYQIPNALSSVGAPPPAPPPQQASGANPPHFRPFLSMTLKRILCERISHADSEVVGFHKEPCGPGRMRVTVTIETPDGA